jgi:hypothetical protein
MVGPRLGGRNQVRMGTMECEWARWSGGGAIECRRVPWSVYLMRQSAGGYKYPTAPPSLEPSITFFLLINHFHCCYIFIYIFISCIKCIYSIYSLRNHGFRGTPRFLRFSVNPCPWRVRCTWVQVQCGKTQPAGHLCGTLTRSGWNSLLWNHSFMAGGRLVGPTVMGTPSLVSLILWLNRKWDSFVSWEISGWRFD